MLYLISRSSSSWSRRSAISSSFLSLAILCNKVSSAISRSLTSRFSRRPACSTNSCSKVGLLCKKIYLIVYIDRKRNQRGVQQLPSSFVAVFFLAFSLKQCLDHRPRWICSTTRFLPTAAAFGRFQLSPNTRALKPR